MEYGFVTMADGSKRKVSRLILGTALYLALEARGLGARIFGR